MGVRCEGVKGDDRRLRLFLLPPLSRPQTRNLRAADKFCFIE